MTQSVQTNFPSKNTSLTQGISANFPQLSIFLWVHACKFLQQNLISAATVLICSFQKFQKIPVISFPIFRPSPTSNSMICKHDCITIHVWYGPSNRMEGFIHILGTDDLSKICYDHCLLLYPAQSHLCITPVNFIPKNNKNPKHPTIPYQGWSVYGIVFA